MKHIDICLVNGQSHSYHKVPHVGIESGAVLSIYESETRATRYPLTSILYYTVLDARNE